MEYAVKGVVVKDGKFLVLKQKVDGEVYYSIPGGRLDVSDEMNELKREIKEETGLDVDVTRYIGEWCFVRKSNGVKTICKTYLCVPLTENLSHEHADEGEDILEFLWMTQDEFLNGEYSNHEDFLRIIREMELPHVL